MDSSEPEIVAETRLQVWKSNDLIRDTIYDMPTAEMKLLFSAISRIKRDGEVFTPVSLTVSELSELMGLERRAAYSDIKGMAESLASRTVHLFDHASRHHKWLNWCDVSYVEGSGRVMILFRDVLKPYLLQLKEKFVQYGLDNVLRLSSSYHIRLYEYLKSWEYAARPHRVKLADLRKFIGAESKAYEAYFTFNGSILKPAHEAIERFTDLRYTYRPVKQARAVVEVEFDISPASDPELPLSDQAAAPEAKGQPETPEAGKGSGKSETAIRAEASAPLGPQMALEAPPSRFPDPAMSTPQKADSGARRAAEALIAYWNDKMTHSPVADAGAERIDSLTRRLQRDAVLRNRWREMIDVVAESEIWNGRGPKGREGAPFHASLNWFLLHRDEVLDAAEAQRAATERRKKPARSAGRTEPGGQESLFAEPVSDEERRNLAAQLRGLRASFKGRAAEGKG